MWHLQTRKRRLFFSSSFETAAVFRSERLLFPFVGREQDPLCHCTTHVVPPKGEPGASQHPSSCHSRITSKHTALQATQPWASLKAFQEEFSKNAGCFLILASFRSKWSDSTKLCHFSIQKGTVAPPGPTGSLTCLLTLLVTFSLKYPHWFI